MTSTLLFSLICEAHLQIIRCDYITCGSHRNPEIEEQTMRWAKSLRKQIVSDRCHEDGNNKKRSGDFNLRSRKGG